MGLWGWSPAVQARSEGGSSLRSFCGLRCHSQHLTLMLSELLTLGVFYRSPLFSFFLYVSLDPVYFKIQVGLNYGDSHFVFSFDLRKQKGGQQTG